MYWDHVGRERESRAATSSSTSSSRDKKLHHHHHRETSARSRQYQLLLSGVFVSAEDAVRGSVPQSSTPSAFRSSFDLHSDVYGFRPQLPETPSRGERTNPERQYSDIYATATAADNVQSKLSGFDSTKYFPSSDSNRDVVGPSRSDSEVYTSYSHSGVSATSRSRSRQTSGLHSTAAASAQQRRRQRRQQLRLRARTRTRRVVASPDVSYSDHVDWETSRRTGSDGSETRTIVRRYQLYNRCSKREVQIVGKRVFANAKPGSQFGE